MQKHDLDLVCRAHQVVEDGYELSAKRQLITLFSAPNYCGEFDNAGAMMTIDETLMDPGRVYGCGPKPRRERTARQGLRGNPKQGPLFNLSGKAPRGPRGSDGMWGIAGRPCISSGLPLYGIDCGLQVPPLQSGYIHRRGHIRVRCDSLPYLGQASGGRYQSWLKTAYYPLTEK
jgi:hypothetical protein